MSKSHEKHINQPSQPPCKENIFHKCVKVHGSAIKIVLIGLMFLSGALVFFALLCWCNDNYTSAFKEALITLKMLSPISGQQINHIPLILTLIAVVVLSTSAVFYLRITFYREYTCAEITQGIIRPKTSYKPNLSENNLRYSTFTRTKVIDALFPHDTEYCDCRRVASDRALCSIFLTACNTPKEIYSCIDERVQTSSRSLLVKSIITFRVPVHFSNGDTFIIPAFFHSRTNYPDSLSILSTSGGNITFLNLTDSLEYLKRVIRTAIPSIAPRLQEEIDDFISGSHDSTNMRAKTLSPSVKSQTSKPEWIEERIESFNNIKNELEALDDQNSAYIIIELLRSLIESYPICLRYSSDRNHDSEDASPDTDQPLRFRASHTKTATVTISYCLPLVHTSGRYKERLPWCSYIARNFVKRPNTIYYGLGNADRTQSYHLQVTGAEDSFCSMTALRRSDKFWGETKTLHLRRHSKQETVETNQTNMGFDGLPNAEMAFVQKRCGQRRLSMSVKNGDGFFNWYLMYRHVPRGANAYSVSLIATCITAALIWIYVLLQNSQNLNCCTSINNVDAAGIVASMLVGVATLGFSWIMRENKNSRGWEIGPIVTAAFIVCAAILVLLDLALSPGRTFTFIFTGLSFACLLSLAFILLMHSLAWFLIKNRLRKENQPSMSLLPREKMDIDAKENFRDVGKVWSPGWLAVDGNRYAVFYHNAKEHWNAQKRYANNRNYIRDTILKSHYFE